MEVVIRADPNTFENSFLGDSMDCFFLTDINFLFLETTLVVVNFDQSVLGNSQHTGSTTQHVKQTGSYRYFFKIKV